MDFPQTRRYLRFGDTFFAYADGDGLTLVDQHAAHERVLYERLLHRTGPASALLVPRRVDLTAAEYETGMSNRETLSALGFMVEPFGGHSILLREIPSELAGRDCTGVFRDIISQLLQERRPDRAQVRKEVAALMACHEAVRARDHLKDPALEDLLRQLEKCDAPDQCPHGRPTRIHLSGTELLKLFRRS